MHHHAQLCVCGVGWLTGWWADWLVRLERLAEARWEEEAISVHGRVGTDPVGFVLLVVGGIWLENGEVFTCVSFWVQLDFTEPQLNLKWTLLNLKWTLSEP